MKQVNIGKATLINIDCMEYMATLPDNAFDLAIVDPPYGLATESVNGSGKLKSRALNTGNLEWDIAPPQEYFKKLSDRIRLENQQERLFA